MFPLNDLSLKTQVILLCFRMRPGQYNLLNRSVNVSIK